MKGPSPVGSLPDPFSGLGAGILTTTVKVSCPACGRRGEVTWDMTDKSAYPGKLQLGELSEGFVAVESSAKAPLRVLCAACRIPAETI